MPEIEAWLQGAAADAAGAAREGVRPVLEALAQAALALRRAEWNADAARDGHDARAAAEARERRG